MSSPDDSIEMGFQHGSDDHDEEDILPDLPPNLPDAVSGETKETHVSTLTSPGDVCRNSSDEFATHGTQRNKSANSNTERTAGDTRRVNRHDVKLIFKGSYTKGAVTMEQVARINKMHEKISDGVRWDFNYSCLLMVASVVAGLGLALDSSTTVISSMLLSPIMGPVVGMSYGLVIWDISLIKRSARNELLSIVVCVIFGLCIGGTCQWTYMAEYWPTDEMLSRGTRTTFLAGIPIAFFSGLGVALSVLDDQTSSLVGVAISASLLPPAVNCGMMFIVSAIKGEDWADFSFQPESPIANLQGLKGKIGYELKGEPNFSQMGIMSLCLTCANVIMVALGATLMFRAKEVLPVNKKIFWDDLKIARRIYQGRAVDPITGEPLTAEDILAAYEDGLAPDQVLSKRSGVAPNSTCGRTSLS